MRILIVGSGIPIAIEHYYAKYLSLFGAEVLQYSAQDHFNNYYSQSVLTKIFFRTGLSSIYTEINDQFKVKVNEFQPDIVWIFKGMEILPSSLKWLKEKRILAANYNPDNPFLFTGKGSGNKNIVQGLNFYDVHFTYDTEIAARLKNEYKIQTEMLPFAFDLSDEQYINYSSENEILRACFVGNPDKKRGDFINQLASEVQIDIYGNSWSKYTSHQNVCIFPEVTGPEFWKVLRKYRVQINMMRIHNENSHNMRTFEVPAIGGIMLAPATQDHMLYFKDGKDAFFYNSETSDCASKIKSILNLSKEQVDSIRKTARQTSLEKGYSYKNRARFVMGIFESLIQKRRAN
jgi:spore maturation protein CgeB